MACKLGLLDVASERFSRKDLAGKSNLSNFASTHSKCHSKLQTPLQDIATSLDIRVTDIGEPHYDDPSLALLFSQLKSKTLQAAKGTSEISGRAEFNFVLQMARVFCRMGMVAFPFDLFATHSGNI
jgi:hypothetical protein